ncbi:MAG: beta-lactamase family protein [Cellvibrionaceae bacterium]|nr:beta-lactamase family protein [Cellvibrionaceae bacterium]
MTINGAVSPALKPLEQAFAESFSQHGDTGASLAVYHRGELVADLWGGYRDKANSLPWQADTCSNIFSAGKALAAVLALQLVDEGLLDLDEAVKHYWPEFANAEATVRQVLCHRSGYSAFKEKMADDIIYDWDAVTAAVARSEPWWQPGTEQGYSPMIFGWLLGELVRRAAGADKLNDLLQAKIAGPLGMRAWFGVPDSELDLLADVKGLKPEFLPPVDTSMMDIFKREPGGVTQMGFTNPMSIMVGTNSQPWRQAQIPGGNGSSNARSMASFYNALLEPDNLLSAAVQPLLWQRQSHSDCDRVLQTPLAFSLGFMLSDERPECRLGRGVRGFGHPGAGGCLGFADPDHDIAFAYTSRDMGQSILLDPRAIRLIDCLYGLID